MYVLLVDDSEHWRAAARAALRNAGFRVATECDGAAGVQAARRDPPDVILMDLDMPTMDGWGAMARLRSDAATWAIPVLVTSASDACPVRVRSAVFCCAVRKGTPVRELLASVRACAARRSDPCG